VIAYAITIVTISADAAFSIGNQTREAIDARNGQMADAARAMVEWTDGIAIEFQEIIVPAEVPVLMAAAGPIALLAAGPVRKSRTKTTKTTKATKATATADAPAPAPARKRAPRKATKAPATA
jgi:hypothetical protein